MALDMSKLQAERRKKFNEEQKKKPHTPLTKEYEDANELLQKAEEKPAVPSPQAPVSTTVLEPSNDVPVEKVEKIEPEKKSEVSGNTSYVHEDKVVSDYEAMDEVSNEDMSEDMIDIDPFDSYEENAVFSDEDVDDEDVLGGIDEEEGIQDDADYNAAFDKSVSEAKMMDSNDFDNSADDDIRLEERFVASEPVSYENDVTARMEAERRTMPQKPKPSSKRIPSEKASRIRKSESVRPASVRNDPVANVAIPSFPRSLVQEVRNIYKDASNNSDALSAFVYAQLGNPDLMVGDNIKELVKLNGEDNTLINVEQRMRHLEELVFRLSDSMYELELLLSFLLFDRLGFRKEIPSEPYDVNILESGINDLIKKVRESADKKRKWDNQSNGRPFK